MPSSAVTAAVLNHVLLGGLPTARAQALHAALIDAAVPPWLPQAMDALAALGADADTAIAAILGASGVALPESERAALAELIEGQAAERQVLALHGQSVGGSNPEGLRRLLLAMTRDLRVVPILLATRLAELRSLADRRDDATLALARAVRDIHAPLANRLGVWQLKWELEDLAFRVLSPDDYRRVAGLVDERRREREHDINTAKKMLETALQSHGIVATISGRPKHIYSIWRKMERKSLPFEGLNDLRALRVMVDSVADCYAALGVAHALWPPVPGEFDDYIARPKHNDYRSLHTAVVGPAGKVFEIQFRTHEMHRSAELGVAAHWRYKEGGPSDSALERRVVWMRQLLDVQAQGGDAALAEEFDSELVEDRIYALTPRGEVVDLPTGSTPLDFAYRLHTELGHRCRGARVDGRIVPLDTPLATGQRVEIIAGKEAAPRRDWLLPGNRYLANARSRDKVRAWFRKLDRARNVQVGREMLERELKRYGRARSPLEPVLDRFQQVNSIDELYMRVALGEIGPTQVLRAITDSERGEPEEAEPTTIRNARDTTPVPSNRLRIGGLENLVSQIARCCQPVPGEPAIGYLTRGHQVSVHRADCPTLLRMAERAPDRVVDVEWGHHETQRVALLVEGEDRPLLARDIVNVVAQAGCAMDALEMHASKQGVQARMQVRVRDVDQLAQLTDALLALRGVRAARRPRS
ncbi:MAG: bifunctional (p)ppGpp synthetase/guanosine-3',5'-bis(diphosphate) 3'-pyrophosphohydrolase [Xanthomonadales bacterium]|nr:bifunctional (p)ppGpp synthetase/guanosine-3',5'-bis(diphosphate) 3'-pyrophosphohydrolase [Xanthomonadales bacterium]